MNKSDLPALRQLAANGQITYTEHVLQRIWERGYLLSDITTILTSATNQLIEVQPPSTDPKKPHKDERIVISDPMYHPDTAVVIFLDFSRPTSPTIVIVTIEKVADDKWDKCRSNDPWLVRKR
jgi:hypothetical protein